MNELALFAGAGGGILGGHLLGWRTICAVENNPYAASVLLARQNDGTFPPFPIWDDICTFNGKPWQGRVDVVSGGFPCQDISVAGGGKGIDGERSGLWREMARVVREVAPRFVYVENSPALTVRGLGTVLSDLASMGYDARWGVLGAVDAGAPHQRDRMWIVADTNRNGKYDGTFDAKMASTQKYLAHADRTGQQKQWLTVSKKQEHPATQCADWWASEPGVGRVAHGMANRSHRLRAIGNGQVPAVVNLAWSILSAGVFLGNV